MLSGIKSLKEIYEWILDIPKDKFVLFLFSVIVTILLFENYNKDVENDRLNSRIDVSDGRLDSVRKFYEERLHQCEDQRLKDVQATSEYWRNKFDKNQEQIHSDYQELKKIRR